MRSRKTYAALAIVAGAAAVAAVAATAVPPAAAFEHRPRVEAFGRTATYPVYLNRPAGEDPATPTVAEISAVSEDGRTLIYTDALARRIGFLDISKPDNPRGLGTLSLSALGDAEDEPTSVAVVGRYVLVVVNTSPGFANPSGRLDVISLADRKRVRSFDLGGQPDSIAISKDQRYAAIAIENERDEEVTPPGGEEGDLPQLPSGFLHIVDLTTSSPSRWSTRAVRFTAPDGKALPSFVAAGIVEPTDIEPEYVSINNDRQVAVTLQENNGIALVDLPTGRITKVFSAGTDTVGGIDTKDDGAISLTGSITDTRREPDSVAWVDDRYLATANEGDWQGGSRGWTVFDSRTGKVAWDAGNTFERLAVRYGLHNEDRAGKKGAEPEGLAIATFEGVRYAFVGSERSNFVAVYDLSRPASPVFRQILAATNGPEGLLPIPSRGLLAVSSENDDATVLVRASVSLFKLDGGTPSFPSIESGTDGSGAPIGWGALGALSAAPGRPGQLYSVTDAAFTPTRILTINANRSPAQITNQLTVTDAAGKPVGYDAEGLFARPQGGFWLASEGATGPANQLVRLNAAGATTQVVALPAQISAGLGKWGLEGVTASTDTSGREQVWVALQREVTGDAAGVVRLGRYDVATGAWTWFGYQLEKTTTAGDWIGLSEIVAVGHDRLAVIERDKLNGPNAKIKRIYTVDIPGRDPAPGTLPVLRKSLAHDVLPDLRATRGWTQEKLEGLTIGGDGEVYAITDNDALADATGETVLLRLGPAKRVFGHIK